jgi:thymidine phosphorylase
MRTTDEARELAELLVRLSEDLGIRASALITDMETPLGRMVGNALEVRESAAFLRGEATADDLGEVARDVAVRLLELKGVGEPARAVDDALRSGAAYEKLADLVRAQGGDPAALEDVAVSPAVREVDAPAAGHVARLDALGVARASLALGAGRRHKADTIDFGAGVELLVRIGDEVEPGQPVARLYGERDPERAAELLAGALALSPEPVEPPPHVLERL